ncbi:MAG: Uma2 family endonuclease [Anaerolineae bacterium]|nr:Uma2 family endonuclease [Anaerolineae bacterium]
MAAQQLAGSPRLPFYVQQFQSLLRAERDKRKQFYDQISEQQKAEFINGEIVVHSPAKLRHIIASKNLFALLDSFVRRNDLGFVGYEQMLITLTRNDHEPDICYFTPAQARTFALDQMHFPAPDLVVEVLSTETVDRGIKFEDYAAHGIAEYWIVDPGQLSVEQYVLASDRYELLSKVRIGTVASTVVKGFQIAVSAIFEGFPEDETMARRE